MASAPDPWRMVPPCTTATASANIHVCIGARLSVTFGGALAADDIIPPALFPIRKTCASRARTSVPAIMSEASTSGGDREIEETVTAASTEDAWTQLIGRADIDKAVAAAQPTSGDAGLPWSYEDTWPLSERQLRHLSFELLLLCPPGELEAEDDPQDEAPQGEASASELPTLSSLSEAQRTVLAEGLSAQLAKCVRGAEQPDGELPSLVRLAAGLEDFAEEEAGAAGGEEALEARLAEISPISPLYLPYISPISPLYLPYISPTSPLYLP